MLNDDSYIQPVDAWRAAIGILGHVTDDPLMVAESLTPAILDGRLAQLTAAADAFKPLDTDPLGVVECMLSDDWLREQVARFSLAIERGGRWAHIDGGE